jgi:serine protease Do
MLHQDLLTQRFTQTPLKVQKYVDYSVPVPDDSLARCWGSGRDVDMKAFDIERTNCQIDSYVFAGEASTGFIQLRYVAYNAPKFSALRFANLHARSLHNEQLWTQGSRKMTAAECSERYIDREGMAMRAVVCMTAYRKLAGLYDMSVLVASLNRPTQGVQGRLDVRGVGFANGLKLAGQYLDAFKWEAVK